MFRRALSLMEAESIHTARDFLSIADCKDRCVADLRSTEGNSTHSFLRMLPSSSVKITELGPCPRRTEVNSRVELRLPKKAAGVVVEASLIPSPVVWKNVCKNG